MVVQSGGLLVTSGRCKARVVLVEPPLAKHDLFDPYSNKSQPLGLWALGTYLKRQGMDVFLMDGGLDGGMEGSLCSGTLREVRRAWIEEDDGNLLSGAKAVRKLGLGCVNGHRMLAGARLESLIERVLAEEPTVIGISCMATIYRETVTLLARRLKQVLPSVPVVCGGQDVTSDPETVVRTAKGGIDYVVLGEGEEAFSEFIQGGMTREAAERAGMALLRGDEYRGGRWRTFSRWGDEPPFDPALMESNEYPASPGHAWWTRGKWTDILFSKGCTFNCKFCYSGRGHLRTMPLEIVDQQLSQLKDAGYEELIVQDDAFGQPIAGSRNYWYEVTRLISKHQFTWQNNNGFTWEFVDKELVSKCRESGCTAAFMPVNFRGFGSPRIDEFRAAKVRRTYELFRDAGFVIHGGGIFGVPSLDCPDQTVDLAWEFVEFQRALVADGLVDAVVVYALSALPGTEWRRGIEEGQLAGKDFRRIKIHGGADYLIGYSNHSPQVTVEGALSYEKLCEVIWDAQVEINGPEKAKEWFLEGAWVKEGLLPDRTLAVGGARGR